MKAVRFLALTEVEQYLPPPGSALISIRDADQAPPVLQPGWLDVLPLRFHDTDGQRAGLDVFGEAQANAVLEFAGRHEECPEIVVHCTMGYSRSAAVAMFLSERYGVQCWKGRCPVNFETWKQYNKLVYRVLHNTERGGSYE